LGWVPKALAQKFTTSFVACVMAAFDCRFALAATCPRAVLAAEFAALSHMLMNGFFFSQGLDMMLLQLTQAWPLARRRPVGHDSRCT
jgi:hypothetical protein